MQPIWENDTYGLQGKLGFVVVDAPFHIPPTHSSFDCPGNFLSIHGSLCEHDVLNKRA